MILPSIDNHSHLVFTDKEIILFAGQEFSMQNILALSLYHYLETCDVSDKFLEKLFDPDWVKKSIDSMTSEIKERMIISSDIREALNVTEEFSKFFGKKGNDNGNSKN